MPQNAPLRRLRTEGPHAEILDFSPNVAVDNGASPLSYAAERGHTGCVEILLEAGAVANTAAMNGCTPLLAAVTNGHTATVETLIHKVCCMCVNVGCMAWHGMACIVSAFYGHALHELHAACCMLHTRRAASYVYAGMLHVC